MSLRRRITEARVSAPALCKPDLESGFFMDALPWHDTTGADVTAGGLKSCWQRRCPLYLADLAATMST
ncbi:hypothetical protein KAM385_08620 [Aeromonas hydrophila]|nr:hypothetical protein KAM385_08620 [Aeromonas hydrophila]